LNGYQNLHTHTTHCDGAQSAEEMIKAAIQKGGESIGFSEHSHVPFDKDYSMSIKETQLYISEIKTLKKKYEDHFNVFLGIELDYATEDIPDGLDFIIGSVHHAKRDGSYVTIDGGASHFEQVTREFYGGDYLSMAESYFATITDIADKTGADIIGHFDLPAKHNENSVMFDEMHPRYIKAALNAMESILEKCRIFEINTGAIYRHKRTIQYPSEYLLRELCKRGGEVTLASDSHNADSLYYKFDEMLELVKACGFKYIKRLTKGGFINEKL